jgi:hypothetical protein
MSNSFHLLGKAFYEIPVWIQTKISPLEVTYSPANSFFRSIPHRATGNGRRNRKTSLARQMRICPDDTIKMQELQIEGDFTYNPKTSLTLGKFLKSPF